MQPVARNWTVERPSYGLALAVLGSVFAALGFFVLGWAAGADFSDVRRAVDQDAGQYSVVTQVYARVLYLPLLLVTAATGLFAAVGRFMARVVTGAAGILGGVGLIAVMIWVETGAVGTDESRRSALPVLVLMALVGVASATLGAGAIFDTRAVLARGLAATVAGFAVILHVYVVSDLFASLSDAAFGAWCCAIGYALLAIAPVLPYRRIITAR